MRLLLDTHALIWYSTADPRLKPRVRDRLANPDSELILSAASVWEMAIKSSLKRLDLPEPLDDYLRRKRDEGYGVLPIAAEHAAAVARLPFHHKDPFDRLLIAQALAENLPVVTSDGVFKKYGVEVIW